MTGEAEPLRLFEEPSIAGQALCDSRARDSLTEVARSARLLGEAQKTLAEWVLTARDEGHSWRRIGTAAGIAHQTLHRRCRAGRSSSSASVPDLD